MAHQLYTPEQAARSTLAAVRYKSTLARLVNTDYSTEFTAGRGASVTVKRPVMLDKARVYTAENRKNGDAITYTDLVQPYTSVSISDQVYQAVKLPDDFVTFTLESLENQVVGPMAESVAEHLNKVVIDAFGSVKSGLLSGFDADPKDAAAKPYLGTNGTAYATLKELRDANTEFAGFAAGVTVKAADLKAKYRGDVSKAIRAAHQLLGQRGVPLNGRYLELVPIGRPRCLALTTSIRSTRLATPTPCVTLRLAACMVSTSWLITRLTPTPRTHSSVTLLPWSPAPPPCRAVLHSRLPWPRTASPCATCRTMTPTISPTVPLWTRSQVRRSLTRSAL